VGERSMSLMGGCLPAGAAVLSLALAFAACSSSPATGGKTGAAGTVGTGGTSGTGGAAGSTASGSTASTSGTGGAPGSCDAFGRFGVPTSTFTLPVQGSPGAQSLAYADVQKSFPTVAWATLDRLYLPAGSYTELQLGNLPARDPAHPLVITNQGGQVFVGNNPNGNYIWSMGGGSGWTLTGRYDPDSRISGGAGTSGNVTAANNTNAAVMPIAFAGAGYPIDQPGHHLTAWAPQATVNSASPVVTYHPGDVVTYGAAPDLYQCSADTTAGPPPDHPEAWTKLPAPVDDVRVAAGSPYAALGVH